MDKSKERKFVCRFCSKEFPSGKSLGGHIRIHTNENSIDSDAYNRNRLREKNPKRLAPKQRECDKEFDGERIVMDSESDTETTSSSPIRKRSKKVMKQESNSLSDGIDQEHKHMAMSLMKMSKDSGFKNSLADSSDNNSVILETKELNMFNGETNQLLVTVDEQLRSGDDDDSDTSASDYFLNGPKKSDSGISVDRNTATGNNKVGSEYELRKSKRVFFPSYETDSCVRSKPPQSVSKKAKKKSKSHECPICFRVFKSGQALGGHKRSHFIGNQEKVARDPIDLNLPAPEIDE